MRARSSGHSSGRSWEVVGRISAGLGSTHLEAVVVRRPHCSNPLLGLDAPLLRDADALRSMGEKWEKEDTITS